MIFDESKYKCYGYDEKNEDGSIRCHCVVAISSYAGKPVKGYAKCHPNDEWDWEKGMALAIARCAEKIAIKRANRANAKLAEAQDILADAIAHMNDMLNYYMDSGDEVMLTNTMKNEILAHM